MGDGRGETLREGTFEDDLWMDVVSGDGTYCIEHCADYTIMEARNSEENKILPRQFRMTTPCVAIV